jgi:hypothetical protein
VVSATPSPSADVGAPLRPTPPPSAPLRPAPRPSALTRLVRARRRILPKTFQGRLTVAFVLVIVLTLGLVSVLVVNRLDDFFTQQQNAELELRTDTIGTYVRLIAGSEADGRPVVAPDGSVDAAVMAQLTDPDVQRVIADSLGQADVVITFGVTVPGEGDANVFVPAIDGRIVMPLLASPSDGQAREARSVTYQYAGGNLFERYTVEVTLADPYTFRSAALAT